MTTQTLPQLNETALVAFLQTQPDIVAAWLFGSLASGRANAQSDVDIAVLLKDSVAQLNPDEADEAELLARAERRLRIMSDVASFANREADVVILNHAPTLLQHEALRCRRLLYEADRTARIDFEVRAGKMYADEQPMRDFFTQVMFKEIQEGRFSEYRPRHRHKARISSRQNSLLKK